MTFWTLDRLAQALADEVVGACPQGSASLGVVTTDTRALGESDVLVALIGERYDAHDFLSEAVRRGAAALVVSDATRVPRLGVPVFVVADTLRALGALGRYRRRAWGGTVVAVAGSNGKTSTTALIASALGSSLEVHATAGNLNNQIGVPLTLLAIPDDAQVAVVEIGTNHPGEIATLRAIVEPNIAVLTSIGEEHLEGLGDLAGVLREECAVFDGVDLAVVPHSQPDVGRTARSYGRRVVEAGVEGGEVRADAWGIASDGTGWFTMGETRVALPLLGAHNVRNALLAMAVARACGVRDVDAAAGMSAMPPLSMRSTMERMGSIRVLNDAYNANPSSAREALAMLDAVACDGPRVAVLATMLELGSQSAALHAGVAQQAIMSKASMIVGIGEFVDALTTVAPGDPRVRLASDAEAAWPLLRDCLAADAVVLLKGSRGTRLERLIPKLREYSGIPPDGETPLRH